MIEKIHKTEEEWKKILTQEQYKIMRQKETEPAFTCPSDKLKTGEFIIVQHVIYPYSSLKQNLSRELVGPAILTPLIQKTLKRVRIILLQCIEPKFCAQNANLI